MSQAEDLLNSIQADNEISLYTSDPQTEGYIVVNSNRFITVPEELKRIAVANDHNIETVTFECPRYWDGHDLSLMHLYINYRSPDESLGCYVVDNVSIDENDSNIMHFDWTITRNVAKSEGKVIFLVCAKQVDENGNETLHWNSELCEDMYVSEGLECDEVLEEEYPDLYTQLIEMINNVNTSYPDMYPKIEKLANDTKKVYDDTNLVYDNTLTVYDNTNQVYDKTKKVYDDLDKLGVGNGVVYTPNSYQDKIFKISSEVMDFKNHNGRTIEKLELLENVHNECMIWQLGNYCRIICRFFLNYSTFTNIWNSAGQMVEYAKEALEAFIIGTMNFRLSALKSEYEIIVKPMVKNSINVGIVYASYDFIEQDNFLGKVNVPARIKWNKTDESLEISLQDIGNFMYNPNYLYPNSVESDIHFPSYFTVDMTFPCKEVGSKVAISELVQNYIEIGATEVSPQNNTMYSGGVE